MAGHHEVVRLATDDPETPGCLISCVLSDAAGTNARFREELERRFMVLEARIAARLDHAAWSEMASVQSSVAAGLAAAIARGVMLRARSGSTSRDLAQIADAGVLPLLQLSD